MALSPGTRLGQYEVVAKLGEGGMGEVYRARDTKLNRVVAIKALHASVAADPERVARFDREAQLLASLNHPNIAAIHGLQEAEGATYLVLEHVDGRPLSDLIREAGPMAVSEALAIARQVADAIAAAHEKGIIHRDLKPGNVMVTGDGLVKVLDFGLGKALDEGRSGASSAGQANSPTMTLAATQQGIILGTAGYMSPEQAKGRDADKRADVWAFGCVLFELLAGTRAFEGEDITETLAAIVRGEPNWSALPAGVPPALRTLIERCLVKDRGQRLSDMSVVRYILSEPASGASAPASGAPVAAPAASGARASGLGWPLVAGLVLITAAATWGLTRDWTPSAPSAAPRLERYSIVLPEGDGLVNGNLQPVAFAPDRSAIVYAATRGGKSQLFLRELGSAEPTPLPGTEGGIGPFFSPDSRWIGFFARGRLKKITVGGTGLQELADVGEPRGGAWVHNDLIYAPTNISGLMKVSANGGTPAQLTQVDKAAGEVSHRWPVSIEGGSALVFGVWTGPGLSEHRLERLSLADGRREVLLRGVDSPGLLAGGFLVHGGRQDAVLAVPWQAGRSLEGVEAYRLPFEALNENEGLAGISIADDGAIAFLQGGAGREQARVSWFDRAGASVPLPIPEREYLAAVVSPDGKRAVLHLEGGIQELWLYEFATQTMTPFVNAGGSSQAPVWTADGQAVIYRGTRAGYRNLFRRALAGGDEERLTTQADVVHTPTSVSRDGKWLVFGQGGMASRGGSDVWVMPLDRPAEAKPLVATDASDTNGQVSPDGRWLAYESTVSGVQEVWVQPFMAPGSPSQVSRNGGQSVRWSPDGRELYFLSANGLMAAAMSEGNAGAPRPLLAGRFVRPVNANSNYSAVADARFLMVQRLQPDQQVRQIEIVLNAFDELRGIRK